jgi:hypothetical protein
LTKLMELYQEDKAEAMAATPAAEGNKLDEWVTRPPRGDHTTD